MKQIIPGKTQFLIGLAQPEQAKKWLEDNQDKARGVCFIGRSNVGKSSLINTIFGSKTARVSNRPGKTREINVFNFSIIDSETKDEERLFLFDLPGYGYAKISKEMILQWQKLMDSFFSNSPKGFLMANLRDCRHPDQKSDQIFGEYLSRFDLPSITVFNKYDKLKNQKERSIFNKFLKNFKNENTKTLNYFNVSAEKKTGIKELESFIINHLND